VGSVMAVTLAESALQVEGVSSQRPVNWRATMRWQGSVAGRDDVVGAIRNPG
jgi:hypothetical protein